MTKEEFLKQVGLSNDEFRDLLQKFVSFRDSLNPAQKDAVQRSMPTLSEAAKSFEPNITTEQLSEILKELLEGIDFDPVGCHGIESKSHNPRRAIADPREHGES